MWGRDAEPHAPGLRKVVSLRRHGGNDGVSDRSRRFMPQTARRMCLCGTQGGRDWRMRRHCPPDGNTREGENLPSGSQERAVPVSKRRYPPPETGERHPPSRPLQRDRSRGQKPLNGVLRGATYNISIEAASSAPSEMLFENPRVEKPLRGCWCGSPLPWAGARRATTALPSRPLHLRPSNEKGRPMGGLFQIQYVEPITRRRLQRPSSWPGPFSSERRLRLPELRPWQQPSSSAQPSWSPCRRRLRRRRAGLPWKRSCPLP